MTTDARPTPEAARRRRRRRGKGVSEDARVDRVETEVERDGRGRRVREARGALGRGHGRVAPERGVVGDPPEREDRREAARDERRERGELVVRQSQAARARARDEVERALHRHVGRRVGHGETRPPARGHAQARDARRGADRDVEDAPRVERVPKVEDAVRAGVVLDEVRVAYRPRR